MREIEFLVRLLRQHGFVVTVPHTMSGYGFIDMIHLGSNIGVIDDDLSGVAKAAARLLGLLTLRNEGDISEEEFFERGARKLRKEVKKAPKAPRPIDPKVAIQSLGDKLPNSSFRFSNRGVPLLVVNNTHSVCWFGSTGIFRVFNNWMNFEEDQKRWDFPDEDGVLEFFKLLSVVA